MIYLLGCRPKSLSATSLFQNHFVAAVFTHDLHATSQLLSVDKYRAAVLAAVWRRHRRTSYGTTLGPKLKAEQLRIFPVGAFGD